MAGLIPTAPDDVTACDGTAWLESLRSLPRGDAMVERALALVRSAGTSVEDLAVASGRYRRDNGQQGPLITALRIEGAEAQQFVAPAVELLLGVEWPSVPRQRTVGVRPVTELRDSATPSGKPVWVYAPRGDTLWLVKTRRPRQLRAVIGGLPSPGGYIEVPEFDVAVAFPVPWTVDIIRERLGGRSEGGPDAIAWDVVRGRPQEDIDTGISPQCTVRVYRSTDVDARGLLERTEDWWLDGTSSPIETGADGLVSRAGRAHFFGGEIDVEAYLRDGTESVVMLMCLGKDLASAELADIAATLRFIASDP